MRAIIEARTDVASVCFFDPVALPADFDQRTKERLLEGDRTLIDEGRIWCQDTGADGGYLFHFYVDEEVPPHIMAHATEPHHLAVFRVPSGNIWACGSEYAATKPGEAGLDRFPHMGQRAVLRAADYTVDVWRTEWPEGFVEKEIRKRVGKRGLKWEARLGPIAGGLFVLTLLGTIATGIQTLPLLWRGGWKTDVTLVWVAIGIAWLVFAFLAAILNRINKSPARRAAELEFPSIVVQMRRTDHNKIAS